ncbi:PTS sugar transporter subunit IIA [Thalassobacillus sp. CUG 92003]|uniref:PTS sugar transporter subunit IIA n=1 Tax=Thalassobacillus sp. CUG 92003 TaxID=2736641 RepID=UPI0015E6A665|nr:PTS sugar transporter subunit IIA [Thalassobacillus sp. CUG 92003]
MSNAIFNEASVQWKRSAEDWQEAVRVSAGPLLQQGKITDDYVQAMITNIIELGPYIIIAPDVALPHARPEQGVNEKGIAITVFQQPVQFGEQSVRILICLAASDKETHLNLLQIISSWIGEDGLSQSMIATESRDELIHLLKNYFIEGEEI